MSFWSKSWSCNVSLLILKTWLITVQFPVKLQELEKISENVPQRTSDDIHLNVFLQRLVKHRITWRKLSALELYLKLMKDRTKTLTQ